MNAVAAAIAAVSAFLIVVGGRNATLADRLAVYLLPPGRPVAAPGSDRRYLPIAWLPAVAAGALVGALLAQGDLFLAGAGRSLPGLTTIGAFAGYFLWSARRSTLADRKAKRFRLELPVIVDALALRVVAGDSIAAAIESVCASMQGVAVDELRKVTDDVAGGRGVPEALLAAARDTAHKDGRRLYDLLGHVHESGGRLASMLAELAVDLRAGIERDLSAEGGKRAIATYGPILALMVPTALLFLLYPTLIGLRELAGTQ